MARIMIICVDLLMILESNIISLIRFIDGGAAMLAANMRNHHMDIVGVIAIIPLVRNDLRVCVSLYEILAKINSADEHKPWAIIISIAPDCPQEVIVIVPAISKPI